MATPITEGGGFRIQETSDASIAAAAGLAPEISTEIPGVDDLAFFKPEDAQYFARIIKEEDETQLTVDEMKERRIVRLLLQVKNGTPPIPKTDALRQIIDKACAGPLFDQILPLLMERSLGDQEWHCSSRSLIASCTSWTTLFGHTFTNSRCRRTAAHK